MAVTRIKNNQITDQTIEYTKIKPYTLVGSLFNPNVTIASNITIQGNLSVSGTTSTVNSVDTLINDPLVIFNNGYVGAPAYDVGVLINRNLSPTNAAWVWREANVGFAGILTSETGTTTGSINNTTYANLIIGNTIIDAYSVNSVTSGTGAFQVRGGAGIFANLNVGGTGSTFGVTTGLVTIDGNVPIVQVSQLASTRYGLMVTDTNNSGAFALRTGTAKGAEIHTFGGTNNDIYIQPDRLKSIWLPAGNAAILADNNLNSSSPNVGAIVVTGSGGIGIGGNLNVGTSASFESQQVFVQSNKLNDVLIGKDHLKSGSSANVVALGAMQGTTSIGVNATIVGAAAGPATIPARATYIGKSAGNAATGTDSTFIGYNSGSLITTGQFNVILGSYDGNVIADLSNQTVIADGAGAPRIRIDAGGNVFVVSSLNSTNSNVGAFVVQGGSAIGGNLNVGGPAAFSSGRVVLEATQTSILLAGNTATTYLAADSVLIGQKIGSGTIFGTKTTIVGSEASNTNTNATENTLIGYRTGYSGPGQQTTAIGSQAGLNLLSSATNNQLFGYNAGSQITTGDYNVVLGANTMTGLETVNNYIMISDGQGQGRIQINDTGVTTVYATTQSTAPSNGALVVYGGIGIGGNSYVGGNLTVTGNLTVLGNTTTLNSTDIAINDSILNLHTFANLDPLGSNDGRDIGIKTHYYISNDRHAFFGFQNSTQNFVYIDAATETAGVQNGTYGNVQFGSLWLSNTTASSNQTTGALVVKGGVGIGGRATINNAVVDNNLTASGTDALITFSPTGTGYVTINPTNLGSMNNMTIGASTPASANFKDIAVITGTSPEGRNATFSGNGFVSIRPVGNVVIYPSASSVNTAPGNMDNMYIGNTTPRQATFTAATVQNDLNLTSFLANSALFIGATGNLAVDQRNAEYNFQRLTGNTFTGVALSLGHTAQDNLLRQGTDTLNVRYQGDSYLENSSISANVLGQTPGWTVSTSRGTAVSPATSQDGDFNGQFGAYAWTGSTPNYAETGSWRYVVQGTTAAASGIGGQAQLWTKRDNGASTLALRVDANQVATFYGQVAIANSTVSTNTTQGALYVQGGMSTSGNLNVGLGARFNDLQVAGKDFYVRGDQDATLIWGYTGTYNQVLIGNSAIIANLVTGAKLQINSTDSMLLPTGTTAQRPGGGSGYGSATPGMLRFNSTSGDLEYYTGTDWYSPQNANLTIVTDTVYNGDGSTVEFSIPRAATTNGTFIAINGVLQQPSVAYNTFGGNTKVVFTEAPAVGDVIDIRTVTLTSETTGISAPLAFVTAVAENSGFKFTTGETTANLVVTLVNNKSGILYSPSNITVGTSAVIMDQFYKTDVRSAKYMINVQSGSEFETSEVLVVHNGTTAYRTQYNRIYTGAAALGSVTTSVVGSNVYVYYTGVSATNYVTFKVDYVGI